MQSHSADFARVVSEPHTVTGYLDVVEDDVVLATLLSVSGGVDADKYANIVRRINCVLQNEDGKYTPNGMRDLLAPFGRVIHAYGGVVIPRTNQLLAVTNTRDGWLLADRDGTSVTDDGALVLGTA